MARRTSTQAPSFQVAAVPPHPTPPAPESVALRSNRHIPRTVSQARPKPKHTVIWAAKLHGPLRPPHPWCINLPRSQVTAGPRWLLPSPQLQVRLGERLLWSYPPRSMAPARACHLPTPVGRLSLLSPAQGSCWLRQVLSGIARSDASTPSRRSPLICDHMLPCANSLPGTATQAKPFPPLERIRGG